MLEKAAAHKQIIGAEKELHIITDKDDKEFIQHFGGTYNVLAIHAFINKTSIG